MLSLLPNSVSKVVHTQIISLQNLLGAVTTYRRGESSISNCCAYSLLFYFLFYGCMHYRVCNLLVGKFTYTQIISLQISLCAVTTYIQEDHQASLTVVLSLLFYFPVYAFIHCRVSTLSSGGTWTPYLNSLSQPIT